MNDEKQMILQMLREGKINVEDASELLEAISERKNRSENITGKLSETFDNIIKKATNTLGKIDLESSFDLDFDGYNFMKVDQNTHKEIRIDDDINFIDLDILNGDIEIERANDLTASIIYDIYSKKENLDDYLNIDINEDTLDISLNNKYSNLETSLKLKISLPKEAYDSLNVKQVNGKVEICDIDFNNLDISTVNGKIILINTTSEIDIKNVNGKIDLKNTAGRLNVDNINGPIYLSNIKGEDVDITNTNGNIRVDGLSSNTLKATSNSGNIRVFNVKNTKAIDVKSGYGNIVIDTTTYDGEVRAFVNSTGINITEKYQNKIQDDNGYEISTSSKEEDLRIDAESSFGKVSLR